VLLCFVWSYVYLPLPDLYKGFQKPKKKLALKMATSLFDETLENLKNSTQLTPENRNYSLNSSCENLRIRFTEKLTNWNLFCVVHVRRYYSETLIYHSWMCRFPGSIVQFLSSLNKSYLNYGNKTCINCSSVFCFLHLLVRIFSPKER
jgi:hypothetical protein